MLTVMSCGRPARDSELIQIMDAALTDASRKAGSWLVCRPGCTQCCVGAFAINPLDAARLRAGLTHLEQIDPERAQRVRSRVRDYLQSVSHDFPGDLSTGLLRDDEDSRKRFESFADEEVCPALDPDMGTCDLYEFRPMTCRVFGPPVRNDDGNLSVCELCFHGATNEQILGCELKVDPAGLEELLLDELKSAGKAGDTIVAFALLR